MARLAAFLVCSSRVAAIASISLCLAAFAVHGAQLEVHLDPRAYTTPGGGYSLKVEPSSRDGSGPGMYTLSTKGKERWSKRLPFALWDAALTQQGVTVGYAYTTGYSARRNPGKLLFIRIDAIGAVRVLDEFDRNRFVFDAVPGPLGQPLMLDDSNDRVIFRAGFQKWRSYRLSNGVLSAQFDPEDAMERADFLRLTEARLIPGTPLILIHWYCYDKTYAALFTLIDSRGKPVWKLTLPIRPNASPGDEFELVRIRARILETSASGRFAVLQSSEGKKVSFSVKAQTGGGWLVQEVGRVDHPPDPPRKEAEFWSGGSSSAIGSSK